MIWCLRSSCGHLKIGVSVLLGVTMEMMRLEKTSKGALVDDCDYVVDGWEIGSMESAHCSGYPSDPVWEWSLKRDHLSLSVDQV